jgi:hypothetical protein
MEIRPYTLTRCGMYWSEASKPVAGVASGPAPPIEGKQDE